jgi:hypothetical protein
MRWTHAHMSNLMYSADIMFKVLLRAHTQTHTLSHTHTLTHSYTHTLLHTHTRTHTHLHTHTHAHTHARTHTHSCIHTHWCPHMQGIEFDEDLAALEEQFGTPRGQPGQWAACLRIVDPATLSTGTCETPC